MAGKDVEIVRRRLQAYADRGIFRGFSEARTNGGKFKFTFVWLTGKPMNLVFDPRSGTVVFKDVLPNMPARSAMYSDIKSFVGRQYDNTLPAHRRIDRAQADVSCINRRGNVSITLRVRKKRFDYGVQKIVNLVHEVFVYLKDCRADYMSESFDLPQE